MELHIHSDLKHLMRYAAALFESDLLVTVVWQDGQSDLVAEGRIVAFGFEVEPDHVASLRFTDGTSLTILGSHDRQTAHLPIFVGVSADPQRPAEILCIATRLGTSHCVGAVPLWEMPRRANRAGWKR